MPTLRSAERKKAAPTKIIPNKTSAAKTASKRQSAKTAASTAVKTAAKKAASKKAADGEPTTLVQKVVLGPAAAIIAAIVGGVFSLVATLVPCILPPAQNPPVAAATEQVEHTCPDNCVQCGHNHHYFPPEADRYLLPKDGETETLAEPSPEFAAALQNFGQSLPEADATPVQTTPSLAEPRDARQPLAEVSVPLAQSVANVEPPKFGMPTTPAAIATPAKIQSQPSQSEVIVTDEPPIRPNLTSGVWNIIAARDTQGTVWNHSTLKITMQRETPDGLKIAGYLDWRSNGKSAGREYVVGNYDDATRNVYLEGQKSAGNDKKLALTAGSAKLSADGRRLTDGTWGSASAHRPAVPGRWEARR